MIKLNKTDLMNMNIYKLIKAMTRYDPDNRIRWENVFELFKGGFDIEKYNFEEYYAKYKEEVNIRKSLEISSTKNISIESLYKIKRLIKYCLRVLDTFVNDSTMEMIYHKFNF